jgi:nucleoid-associated protein YgaU
MDDPGSNTPATPGGSEQPTEKMPTPKGPPAGGWGPRLAKVRETVRENPIFAIATVGVAALALIVLAVAALSGGGGTEEKSGSGLGTIRNAGNSWLAGQSSLVSYDQFGVLAGRANIIGEDMQAGYVADQAKRDRDRVRARERARERARQRYLEARRRAKRQYEAALAKAKRDRARKLAEQKRKRAELLARLREENKIEPGDECSIPKVRRNFNCETGYPF